MNRPLWAILLMAVTYPYLAFRMWQTWGKPEFWPLVIGGLIFGLIVANASRNRQEDLKARLPCARTLGH